MAPQATLPKFHIRVEAHARRGANQVEDCNPNAITAFTFNLSTPYLIEELVDADISPFLVRSSKMNKAVRNQQQGLYPQVVSTLGSTFRRR